MLVAWIFRMDVRQRRTLSIEGGMQNAGLGTVLALAAFRGESGDAGGDFCIYLYNYGIYDGGSVAEESRPAAE